MAAAHPPAAIDLSQCGEALVWSVEAITHLHTHHILGSLTGALSRIPHQTLYTGVPLLLAREEVVCCVAKGYARITATSLSHYAPATPDEMVAFAALVDEEGQQAHAKMQEKKRNRSGARGGGRGREERRAGATGSRGEAGGGERTEDVDVAGGAGGLFDSSDTPPVAARLNSSSVSSAPTPTATIASPTPRDPTQPTPTFAYTPAQSSSLPWYHPPTTPTPARALWNYLFPSLSIAPTTDVDSDATPHHHDEKMYDQARATLRAMVVFRDLHGQGYYMTPGDRFGGEWLVYYGSPVAFHSHYITTILPGVPRGTGTTAPHVNSTTPTTTPLTLPKQPLMDLAASCRVGTAVKKMRLLCSTSAGYDVRDWDEAMLLVGRACGVDELVAWMEERWMGDRRRDVEFWSVEWTGWS
ncbi:hypothetical protein M427DRAFT_71982 [Gonapodya prolifera JEL478]|uniref:tRNA-intron lyase n=1 Tax=Gonapodya prolifera (strain JEL478) TaxID=1344416 RepID=A0A139A6R8_GONPJ|nr:hypothetical protein M427DRAFT_71982 [Gonapodya prolifera JEL478]|eukprot:KXS12516.1 hypothetical protein M427DRAFT_71982 [Gonapodya prolifera JEL478]